MKEKEFNLSENMELFWKDEGDEGEEYFRHRGECYREEDVKEFIRLLKEEFKFDTYHQKVCFKIDKLAGKELTEGEE